MNRTIFLLCVLITSFSAFAQNTQEFKAITIEFNKTTHDYGTITKGADGSCEFVFTNKGQSPLILSKVNSSCGCTVPEWPKKPILPGEKGSIKVKYDTKRIGSFAKSITVFSNASDKPVVLRIMGVVQQ